MFFVGFCTLAVITGRIFSSCTQTKGAALIDVVNGTMAVNPHDTTWRKEFIAKLKPLTPEQRRVEIDRVLPRLNSSIMSRLDGSFNCTNVAITYMFGSGTADSVASGDGKKYSGYFKDELYAVVKSPNCITDSVTLFVKCFNGWVTMKADDGWQVIGSYDPVFTIEKDWGINRYVDYRTAIWLAEKFQLTIYEGHGKGRKVITPEKAYALEGKLGENFVNVPVDPGDVFNLGNMTYTHSGEIKHAAR